MTRGHPFPTLPHQEQGQSTPQGPWEARVGIEPPTPQCHSARAGSIQHLAARAGGGPVPITFSRRNGAIYLSRHLTWQKARARLLEGLCHPFLPRRGRLVAPRCLQASEPALAPRAKLWNYSKRFRFWGNEQPGKTLNPCGKWKVWRRPWLHFGICLWDLSAGELMSLVNASHGSILTWCLCRYPQGPIFPQTSLTSPGVYLQSRA